MSAQLLEDLIQQASQLTPDEQLRLATRLIERARQATTTSNPPRARRKWKDICGALPYPALGEDAQAWVSRTRQEADERRMRQLRREA